MTTRLRAAALAAATLAMLGLASAATPPREPSPTAPGADTSSPRPAPVPQPGQCDVQACYVVKVPTGTGYQTVCSTKPLPDGTACDDGSACTVGDACKGGKCISGASKVVDDAQLCTTDACDPKTGIVSHAKLANGTLCDGPWQQSSRCMNGMCDACPWGTCLASVPTYDCHANHCSAAPGEAPDVACWLTEHPMVMDSLRWWKPDGSDLFYKAWEPWRRQQLQDALLAAWAWKKNGMTGFTGTAIPEPPPNKAAATLSDQTMTVTVFDEQSVAWPLYLANVAHVIAAEVGHWVPWSICDYIPNSELYELTSPTNMFHPTNAAKPADGFTVHGIVTPAHPTVTFKFLADNGLIGATRLETIGNTLEWSRRLSHTSGAGYLSDLVSDFHYAGLPPVSRTLEGTFSADPEKAMFYGKRHYTLGCHGTTGVLRAVLAAANIPVKEVDVCGHALPYFMADHVYLSHGDDPYGFFGTSDTTISPPMTDLLIDQATYSDWFVTPGQPASCANISRREAQLAVEYVPDVLVWQHCDDLSHGIVDHAQTAVYHSFQSGYGSFYTLAELDAATFWSRLDQRTADLGGCAAQCSTYQSGFCAFGNGICPTYAGPVCPFAQ